MPPKPRQQAIVIGAGLAGACAAYALAQRGWAVTVVDSASSAAQGASALPVGLMARKKGGAQPAQSQADSGQPDWEGVGMACTRRWLEHFSALGLLQRGLDWQACGTAHSLQWQKKKAAAVEGESWQWQEDACWIKPQRLVAACLQHPSISCRYGSAVQSLQRSALAWQVQLGGGETLEAAALVLAVSVGSAALLRTLPLGEEHSALRRLQDKQILNATAGLAIYAPWQAEWHALLPLPDHAAHTTHTTRTTAHACNGHGHFVPAVAQAGGSAFWLSGATYVHQPSAQAADTDAGQAENLQRLAELLPNLAALFAQQDAQGQIQRFAGVRCTTPTRLPELGEIAPGLWLSAGFGSRALSHAPLAAECLAEHIVSAQ